MKPRIVIVGGGFAGVAAARALSRTDADVLLIDRRNHHIFQPLLYQVATAVLSSAEVAAPLRQLVRRQPNLSVLLGEAINVDATEHTVTVAVADMSPKTLPFDYLVVATGVRPTYFGHEEFAQYAPALKTITDAEIVRDKILRAYERAEQTDDLLERQSALTFVLVGAGPTGVELAASIAQLARVTLVRQFRRINPADTAVILLDSAPRVLPTFSDQLSRKVAEHLKELGVEVRTGVTVEHVDKTGVIAGGARISTYTVLWTAGVRASALLARLDTATDRAGRALVTPSLALKAHPNIFVVGDAASLMEGERPLPGVAQVAIQEGRFVGRLITLRLRGLKTSKSFHYRDRGNMAVVGKNYAILERNGWRLSGRLIWLVWALVHVMFLPQLQNRLRVQIQWVWSYITGQRGSRLIREMSGISTGELSAYAPHTHSDSSSQAPHPQPAPVSPVRIMTDMPRH